MARYIVRPYYGYDCDSTQGFNNGTYLDPIEVDAADEDAAIEVAMNAYLFANLHARSAVRDWEFGDGTLCAETSWYDGEGNEITRGEWEKLNETREVGEYRYEYVDFNNVEPAGD